MWMTRRIFGFEESSVHIYIHIHIEATYIVLHVQSENLHLLTNFLNQTEQRSLLRTHTCLLEYL